MEEIFINYPLFYPCNLIQWQSLEQQANEILGLPSEDGETYSKPFKDSNGQIYFIVYESVQSLVDINECLESDKINW